MDRYLRLLGVAGLAGLANVLVAVLPGIWMPAITGLDTATFEVAFGVLSTANRILHYGTLTLAAVVAGFWLADRGDGADDPASVGTAFALVGVLTGFAVRFVSAAISTVQTGAGMNTSWLATTVLLFALSGLVGSMLAQWSGGGDGDPGAVVVARSG